MHFQADATQEYHLRKVPNTHQIVLGLAGRGRPAHGLVQPRRVPHVGDRQAGEHCLGEGRVLEPVRRLLRRPQERRGGLSAYGRNLGARSPTKGGVTIPRAGR